MSRKRRLDRGLLKISHTATSAATGVSYMSNTSLSIELLKLMQATRRYLTEIKLNEHIYMFNRLFEAQNAMDVSVIWN